jgi:hypothetical protein
VPETVINYSEHRSFLIGRIESIIDLKTNDPFAVARAKLAANFSWEQGLDLN